MSGTKIGALKAAATNKARYGEDFYRVQGAKGGKLGRTGGFASESVGKDGLTGQQRARKVGKIGGRISRRKPTTTKIAVTDASPEAVDISMAATEAATL